MKSEAIQQFLKEPSVIFDEKAHTYKTSAGELYTGCTTISDAWDKSFFLGPWYAKEMAIEILTRSFDEVAKLTPPEFEKFITQCKGAAKRKSDSAKIAGTLAHDWIASYLCAHIDPHLLLLPTPENLEAQNAIEAFVHWAKKQVGHVKWLATEEVVCSDEHRIGGKLDAIASFDGIPFIVDFKTSGQFSPSYLLQCAGYDLMLREMGFTVAGYKLIRIPKDGSDAETLTITNAGDMQFFRETFLKQREAHKFYVYMEGKFKGLDGKMRVDLPEIEKVEIAETNYPTTTMAKYKEQTMVGGKWAKAADIKSGIKAKIVSETEPQSSTFTNKDGSPKSQDVCKVQFQGSPEALNVSLNRATINGLVKAFGEDSASWMNHVLTVETEKMRVAGKAVVALYLIPDGYERVDDENGYAMIVKKGTKVSGEIPDVNLEEVPDAADFV